MLLRRVLRPSQTLLCSVGFGSKTERSGFLPRVSPLARPTTAEPAPCRQGYGTHSSKEPLEPLSTAHGARDFVYSLHSKERKSLLEELQKFESIAAEQGERADVTERTWLEMGGRAEVHTNNSCKWIVTNLLGKSVRGR